MSHQPMFKKRHYEAMASMLKRQRPADHWDANKMTQWLLIRNDVMQLFAEDNPAFDEDKFVKACMPEGH